MADKKSTKNQAPREEEIPVDNHDTAIAGKDIGRPAPGVEFADADPMAAGLSFMPGQNWTEGQVLTGKFVETERIYSTKAKKPNWKLATDGRVYRDLHHLTDAVSGDKFSIWSVGVLGNFFAQVPVDAPVAITYTGLATEALKEGQNPPHTFDFKLGKGYQLTRNKPAAPAAQATNIQQ